MPHLDIFIVAVAFVAMLVGVTTQRVVTARQKDKQLIKPFGHIGWLEPMVEPLIVLVSTALATIATYSLAFDEVTRILDGHASGSDYVTVAQSMVIGFAIDSAAILAGTRIRAFLFKWRENKEEAKKERPWFLMAVCMLLLVLVAEGMTNYYFAYRINPGAFVGAGQLMQTIHDWMTRVRSGAPVLVLFFFVAGILPNIVSLADRKRHIQAATSQRALACEMVLINPDNGLGQDQIEKLYIAWDTSLDFLDFSSDATTEQKGAHEELKRRVRKSRNLVTQDEMKTLVTMTMLSKRDDDIRDLLNDYEARIEQRIADKQTQMEAGTDTARKSILDEVRHLLGASQDTVSRLMQEVEDRVINALAVTQNAALTNLNSSADDPVPASMVYSGAPAGSSAHLAPTNGSMTQLPPTGAQGAPLQPLAQAERPSEPPPDDDRPRRTRNQARTKTPKAATTAAD